MAQNMVLSYLHFGILKFPLTTYTAQVDSKRPQDTKLLGLLGSAMIYPHWFYFDLYNTICHGGRFRQLPWTTPSSRRTGPPATAPRCSSRRKVPFSCGDAMLAALKSWVNHGQLIMGKSWDNHGKIIGKSWLQAVQPLNQRCFMENPRNLWEHIWRYPYRGLSDTFFLRPWPSAPDGMIGKPSSCGYDRIIMSTLE